MSETCKICKKKFASGIWIASEFKDGKVFLFCSDKCKKEYLCAKLEGIRIEYPGHYEKLMKSKDKGIFSEVLKK